MTFSDHQPSADQGAGPSAVRTTKHTDEYQVFRALFDELADTSLPVQRHNELREQLVTGHAPLAEHIAWRFRNRGQPVEDLQQVATIGLINAVDRFDPSRGKDFLSFAVPTITGVVRRHFRDSAWSLRVPRRLKELQATVSAAAEELSQRLGSAPRPSEIARHLGIPLADVLDGLEAAQSYRSGSLDEALQDNAQAQATIAVRDADLDGVENRELLRPALARLPEREQAIIAMRFGQNLTQTQIAVRIGISQMHVSRLLNRSLHQLREHLSEESTAGV